MISMCEFLGFLDDLMEEVGNFAEVEDIKVIDNKIIIKADNNIYSYSKANPN